MKPQEALNVLHKAARQYHGNAEEHELIAFAARTLQEVVEPPKSAAAAPAPAGEGEPAPDSPAALLASVAGPQPVSTVRGRVRERPS